MEHSANYSETLKNLAVANKILVNHGILDAFGHVSTRNPDDPDSFLLSRNLAPGLVTENDIQTVDYDGNTQDGRPSYLERFLHAEIYRRHSGVHAIVHSHSAAMVAYSISEIPLTAVWHMAGFLGDRTPVFEIRDFAGEDSDLLIRNSELGAALSEQLGSHNTILMRGHGFTTVGDSLQQVVARSIYADLNAKTQTTAMMFGTYTALTSGESVATATSNNSQFGRAWEIWKSAVS